MGDLLKDITPRYSPPRRLVHPGSLLTQGIRSPRRFATYKGPLLGSRSTRSSPPRHRQGPRPRCRQGSGPKLHQGSGPTRRQGPGPGSCRHPGLRPGVIAQDPKKPGVKCPGATSLNTGSTHGEWPCSSFLYHIVLSLAFTKSS